MQTGSLSHSKSAPCTSAVRHWVVAQIAQLAQNYTMENYQSEKLTEIKLWSHALCDLLDLDYSAAKEGSISVEDGKPK